LEALVEVGFEALVEVRFEALVELPRRRSLLRVWEGSKARGRRRSSDGEIRPPTGRSMISDGEIYDLRRE
jgi:hypothetical protein